MVRTGSPAAATPVRHVDDAERRARLARRHAIAPAHRVDDAVGAARAVVCLHATEPATVYLSAFARVTGLERAHVADALYRDRSVVKQLAMRRTLFAAPRDLLPAVLGSASSRVAGQQRSRLEREVEGAGLTANGPGWLAAYGDAVLEALGTHGPLTTQELCAVSADLAVRLGDPDGPTQPLTARVLTVLGAQGWVVRGAQDLGWRSSRPRWTLVEEWLGERPEPLPEEAGYADLVGRWLTAFGPGTEDDLVWWSGSTRAAVRRALADLGAVTVTLDGGDVGHLLPDDVEPEAPVEPWAALLPVLDPTTMGWKDRGFYLGDHRPLVFDRNGNAGTTAWWDGRVVGAWHQDASGTVVLDLLDEVGAAGRRALEHEAARLTGWLAGERVGTVYPSPLMRAHAAGSPATVPTS